jgi:hypothetical protein
MPRARRPRRQPTDDWQQLRLLVTSPEQAAYELLRPIVLFGQAPTARAWETGVPERTLRRKVARFEERGRSPASAAVGSAAPWTTTRSAARWPANRCRSTRRGASRTTTRSPIRSSAAWRSSASRARDSEPHGSGI